MIDRTGHAPRELRLLQADGGLVVFLSVVPGPDTKLSAAHELVSRLEDDIREAQPDMTDVVVHMEPVTTPTAEWRWQISAGQDADQRPPGARSAGAAPCADVAERAGAG